MMMYPHNLIHFELFAWIWLNFGASCGVASTLTHQLTHPPTHPLTHPPTHPLLTHRLTHPITHPPTHPLIHPFTHPLTHPLTHSPTHSPTHSLTPLWTFTSHWNPHIGARGSVRLENARMLFFVTEIRTINITHFRKCLKITSIFCWSVAVLTLSWIYRAAKERVHLAFKHPELLLDIKKKGIISTSLACNDLEVNIMISQPSH